MFRFKPSQNTGVARLVGLDLGTTSCKAVVIDGTGRLLDSASCEYELLTPRPGWTEQAPEDWWSAAADCLSQLGERPDALGLTGQMHGSVFLDAGGAVIRPAILWNDQRTAAEAAEFERRVGRDRLLQITRNPALTGFQAPKVLWLKGHEPDNFAKLATLLLPKDYIRFRLSGEKVTDTSDASGTCLFDVAQRRFCLELAEAAGLGLGQLPGCVEGFEPTGRVSAGVLPDWEGVLIAGGGGDQAAGAVGTGAVTPDVVSVSLGTSGVVFSAQNDAAFDPEGRVHTFCHANGSWHSMSVMLSCGGALRWARDAFGFKGYDEMASLAAERDRTDSVFLPYLAGERAPHNDPNLRAGFRGLSLTDGRAEIAGAVFDGVTFGLCDGLDILTEIRGGRRPEALRVTGGGAASDYWMQLLADATGCVTVRIEADEGPAFGAALLAGVCAGVWPSVEEAAAMAVQVGREFRPGPQQEAVRERRIRWLAQVAEYVGHGNTAP